MSLSSLSGISGLSGIISPAGAGGGPGGGDPGPTLNTTNLYWHSRASKNVTHVSNAVTEWDKIAGSSSLTLVNTSVKPTLNPSDPLANSEATIQVGANDQSLFMNTVGKLNTTTGSVIMVLYFPQTNDNGDIVSLVSTSGSSYVRYVTGPDFTKFSAVIFDSAEFDFGSGNTAFLAYDANTLLVLTFAYDGSTYRIRTNNTEIATWANTFYLDSVEPSGGGITFQLGGSGVPSPSSEVLCHIAEVAFYTDYNLTKIQAAEQAMIDFYGIA